MIRVSLDARREKTGWNENTAAGCPAGKKVVEEYVLWLGVPHLKQTSASVFNDGMTVLLQEGIHLIFDGATDFNQVMSVCSQ